jgi:hypothetical protein
MHDMTCHCCEAHRSTIEQLGAARRKIGRMRKALRQLNKAHRILWKVIGLRNDFHDYAVSKGVYVEYRRGREGK